MQLTLLWCASRVANLAFLKQDFEIQAFFEHIWSEKANLAFSVFTSVGMAWLWQNIVWAAYSLQIFSDEGLMIMQGAQNIAKDFTVKNDQCYW